MATTSLRRFAIAASARKNLYILLTVPTTWNSPKNNKNRSKVYVLLSLFWRVFSLSLSHPPLSLTSLWIKNQAGVLYSSFTIRRFLGPLGTSANLRLVYMDLAMLAANFIVSFPVFIDLPQFGGFILIFCFQFMVQGGDFTQGNGTGGKSIYGDRFSGTDTRRSKDIWPMAYFRREFYP